MNEYQTMTTGRLLRLLGSREQRRKHASATYIASAPYTDAMDESIVEDVASELEDRIDAGKVTP